MEPEISTVNTENEVNLYISKESREYLNITAKWAMFLAVMGFIGTGFIALAGLVFMFVTPLFNSLSGLKEGFAIPSVGIGLLYFAMATLYFFPAYYLYKFSERTKTAINFNNQEALDESLKNQKRMYKFVGIFTIVIISLYLIAIPTIFIFSISKGLIH